jgi:hypothetical protein
MTPEEKALDILALARELRFTKGGRRVGTLAGLSSNRTAVVKLRVSPEEKALMTVSAHEMKIDLSDMIRGPILENCYAFLKAEGFTLPGYIPRSTPPKSSEKPSEPR